MKKYDQGVNRTCETFNGVTFAQCTIQIYQIFENL